MHEECGVFALYGNGFVEDPAEYAYLALYAMQHRGQQSCGIAVSNGGVIESTKVGKNPCTRKRVRNK